MSCNRNEYNLKPLARIHWRASLLPATMVIPAPIVYNKAVAVKKLIVGFGSWLCRCALRRVPLAGWTHLVSGRRHVLLTGCVPDPRHLL